MVPLLKQMNTHPGTWCAALGQANVFFSNPVPKGHQKLFAFSWQSQQYSFKVLSQGYIHSPALCPNLSIRNLDHLSLPRDTARGHYIDNILSIEPSRERENPLDLLARHSLIGRWEVNLTKFQGPSSSVKFLDIQRCGEMLRYPF